MYKWPQSAPPAFCALVLRRSKFHQQSDWLPKILIEGRLERCAILYEWCRPSRGGGDSTWWEKCSNFSGRLVLFVVGWTTCEGHKWWIIFILNDVEHLKREMAKGTHITSGLNTWVIQERVGYEVSNLDVKSKKIPTLRKKIEKPVVPKKIWTPSFEGSVSTWALALRP